MKAIERLSKKIGDLAAWLLLVMGVLTFVIVVLRYVFNISFVVLQESVLYLHATIFMLGLTYALSEDAHVRVDVFFERWSKRRRAFVYVCGIPLLLWPTCVFLIYQSYSYVTSSWSILESSADPGGLPFVYLLKTLLILAPVLIVLQSLVLFRAHWRIFNEG